MMFTEFWLLFVFHLFMKIVDPLKSWIINRPEHTTKVYITEVTLVILIGLIVPTITITATDGYRIALFPPSQCFSDPEIFFHGIMLTTIIMCIRGISLILSTFLHIHRVRTILVYYLTTYYSKLRLMHLCVCMCVCVCMIDQQQWVYRYTLYDTFCGGNKRMLQFDKNIIWLYMNF